MSNINKCYNRLPEKDYFLSVWIEDKTVKEVLPNFRETEETCVCLYGVSDEELRTRIKEVKQYADELTEQLKNKNCECFDVVIMPILFFDKEETAQIFVDFVNQLIEQEYMDLIYDLRSLYNEPWKSAKLFLYENHKELIEELKVWCFQNGCDGDFAIEGKKLLGKMLRTEERIIFDRWKVVSERPDAVVMDGIIDMDTWLDLSEGNRVVFVLRDKNGQVASSYVNDDEYPNNFRKELAEIGSGAKTWNNVARWGQVLIDPDLTYDEVKYFSSGAERGKALRSVSAINILKEYGVNRTNRSILDKVSENEVACSLIKKQLSLYQPNIVIACGMRSKGHKSNMEILAEIYGITPEEYRVAEINERSYRYFIYQDVSRYVTVIEFYHPQATKAAAFGKARGHRLWEEMFNDIKELRKVDFQYQHLTQKH